MMDSTHNKANADTRNIITIEVTRRPEAYWDELNQTVLPEETIKKVRNPSDPEAGYMNRTGKPKGFHYLPHLQEGWGSLHRPLHLGVCSR